MDAYSPFPVEGLGEALGFRTNAIPLIGLAGGDLGALTGFGMQVWIHASALPINVGGRPLDSWPSFIPVTFEMAVLFAALFDRWSGLLVLNGLPEPYHPVFNVAAFARATRDRFFCAIQADDPQFDTMDDTRSSCTGSGAGEVAGCGSGVGGLRGAGSLRCRWCWSSAAVRRWPSSRATGRISRATCSPTAPRPASPADTVARGHLRDDALLFTGKDADRAGQHGVSVSDHPRRAGAWARAVRNLLCAVPRADRRRRWHGRAAWLQSATLVSHRPLATGAGGALLRRDHQWLRRDAELCGAGAACNDRWAIIAYIRALQLSQHATMADLPLRSGGATGAAP